MKSERDNLYSSTLMFENYCNNYTTRFFSKSTRENHPRLTVFTVKVSALCCIDRIVGGRSNDAELYKKNVRYLARNEQEQITRLKFNASTTPYQRLVQKIAKVLYNDAKENKECNVLSHDELFTTPVLLNAFRAYLEDNDDDEFCSNLEPWVDRANATAASAAGGGPLDLDNAFRIKLRFV